MMRDVRASVRDRVGISQYRRLQIVSMGVASGLVAGGGQFMFARNALRPTFVGDGHVVAIIVLAGVYAYLMPAAFGFSLRGTVATMLCGAVVSVIVVILLWISPLWIFRMNPGVRDLLVIRYLQQALTSLFVSHTILYGGGYLGAVSVGGYLDL